EARGKRGREGEWALDFARRNYSQCSVLVVDGEPHVRLASVGSNLLTWLLQRHWLAQREVSRTRSHAPLATRIGGWHLRHHVGAFTQLIWARHADIHPRQPIVLNYGWAVRPLLASVASFLRHIRSLPVSAVPVIVDPSVVDPVHRYRRGGAQHSEPVL